MNKQSYPEYLFKHLRRNSKRILSIMLAFAILTENPLSAYASTKATPSNIPESSASIESTDTNIDIDTDFGVEDFETNPDQDPDHGPGIDSTTPTYPYYRPVVDTSTIPDEIEMNNDDIDAILGAGANCIDDFDPDNLEPLTPEQIETALNPESLPYDPNLENITETMNEEVSAQNAAVIAAGVAAAMAIMWAIGCSAVKTSDGDTFYNKLCSFADSFTSVNFNYILKNTAKSAIMNQAMFVGLKAKLDKSKSADGYSVSLSDEDKLAFAYTCYALNKSNAGLWSLQDLKPTNVNVKAVDGFKYYYFSPDSYVTPTSNVPVWYKVTYTPEKAALGMISQNNVYLYYRNAATADYGFSQMKVHDSKYSLSKSTGLYEYNTGVTRDYVATGQRAWYNIFYQSMPFPCVSGSSVSEKLATYITTKDALLLDCSESWRCGSLSSLMDLSTVTLKGDIYNTVKSEKNIFATTSALNSVAGTVTDTTTGTGTETKPGTGTGTGSGSTTTPDYSGPLTTIIGIITSILTATNGIPNILSLFQLLPTTIKDSIIEALNSIPFFKSALIYLSSISTGVQDILDWDIEAWIDGVNTDLGHAIDNLGADVLQKLANLPNIDNLGGIIGAALAGSVPLTRMADAVVNIADKLKTWNIDNYGEEFIKALETAMAALGLGSLSGALGALKDLTGAKLDDVLAKLQELAASLAGLKLGTDLDSLSNALKELLTALGLGSLLGAVTNIGSMLGTFSFADLMNLIKALPASIVAAITEALPNWKTPEIEESENDSGFHNFLNLFMIGLLIILLLMILFINCLRFIVLVFNVPASSALIHADMLKGIEYMKNLQIPVFGVSLYALLLSCAYFVIFMTVIAAIRRKIDKMHI